jgi:hypothetical protein
VDGGETSGQDGKITLPVLLKHRSPHVEGKIRVEFYNIFASVGAKMIKILRERISMM